MLRLIRRMVTRRRENELRNIPIDFVISWREYVSVMLYSDIELVEEFVANTPLSNSAMRELLRRYEHYDLTAPLFAAPVFDQYSTIHIGEVS